MPADAVEGIWTVTSNEQVLPAATVAPLRTRVEVPEIDPPQGLAGRLAAVAPVSIAFRSSVNRRSTAGLAPGLVKVNRNVVVCPMAEAERKLLASVGALGSRTTSESEAAVPLYATGAVAPLGWYEKARSATVFR